MANMSKKYNASAELVDRSKLYDVNEAIGLVCQTAKAKFDETVEIHIRLGVDSRHADQQVRGAVVLPNGTGKNVKVLVFAKGDNIEKAQAAGIESGSGKPNKTKVAKITKEQVRKIAETKMPDLNASSVETAMSMIAGTARSMGVTVEE